MPISTFGDYVYELLRRVEEARDPNLVKLQALFTSVRQISPYERPRCHDDLIHLCEKLLATAHFVKGVPNRISEIVNMSTPLRIMLQYLKRLGWSDATSWTFDDFWDKDELIVGIAERRLFR